MSESRLIVLITSAGGQALDVCGPADVFSAANLLGASPFYRIEFASALGGLLQLSNGLRIETRALSSIRTPVHTLMVGGSLQTRPEADPTVAAVSRLARRSTRVTSVCTGAFVLAEAGLLNGRQATTHWSACRRLARHYPQVTVLDERIYVQDGHVWTSAGVTAGMDLALALVSDDHGPALAREIAKWLVIYLQRPGGQSQFSYHLTTPLRTSATTSRAIEFIERNFAADCSVERVAGEAAVSVRQLTRLFTTEVGDSPAKFVQTRRLSEAKLLLETTDMDLGAVAHKCGFPRLETLHRAFRERFGVTPAQHRNAFGTGPARSHQSREFSTVQHHLGASLGDAPTRVTARR